MVAFVERLPMPEPPDGRRKAIELAGVEVAPVKTGRPMGLAVGVMVLLPMTIFGIAAEGKTLLVMGPADVLAGVDCLRGENKVSRMMRTAEFLCT